jgi:hypothetical protein
MNYTQPTSDQNIILKKWAVTTLIVLGTGIFTAAMWISKMETTMVVIEKTTDLHTLELKAIRDGQVVLSNQMAEMQKGTLAQTKDRYHRTDADRDWKFHRQREHLGGPEEVPHTHIGLSGRAFKTL